MVRNRIIEEAGRLFDLYGIKAVSMDNIASWLNISKKTIYGNFRNKEELVFEYIRVAVDTGIRVVEDAEEKAVSPLEAIILINTLTLEQVTSHCPAFFRDLESYPTAKLKVFDEYVSLIGAKYIRHFFSCMEKGLFFEGTDMPLILDFFMEQLKVAAEKFHAGQSQKEIKFINVIITFLAGMCTEKGREELILYQTCSDSRQGNTPKNHRRAGTFRIDTLHI
ncbi:MAG: TetR/AcrR family transcriptional regulator [Bacteroidales bacterium]|jgi:AcrR family transcriptional regulator|nr:TetR/AcrR family transcriptional regulator [Bacteroidales bacterium]